jgi:hypothetical protein
VDDSHQLTLDFVGRDLECRPTGLGIGDKT